MEWLRNIIYKYMQVFELNYPGSWLNYPESLNDEVTQLIRGLEHELTEAATALNLFELQRIEDLKLMEEQREAIRREATTEPDSLLAAEIPISNNLDPKVRWDQLMQRYEQIKIESKRQKWASGKWPRNYSHQKIFLYAKAFLYSLDTFGKMLENLAKVPGVPDEVVAQKDSFYSFFTDLIGVRNSSHHMEDRVIGKSYDKPIPLTGPLYLSNLFNDKFGCTKSDGTYGEVEVSTKSAEFVRNCLQQVIDSFDWIGPASHYPSE